jgi:IS30 family transposase
MAFQPTQVSLEHRCASSRPAPRRTSPDLAALCTRRLGEIADKLNGRPQETLGLKTPAEKLEKLLKEQW